MTDQNANKIDLLVRERPTPDGHETSSEATPAAVTTPVGDAASCPHLSNSDDAATTSSQMPVPNPFGDAAGASPLKADLHNLAARDSGVQLTETYRVHVGTSSPLLLTARPGLQAQEDQLAHIGMAVRVTRTVEATGVPVGEASATAMEPSPTQTVTTHREASGVIVGVLDNLLPDELPAELENDDLYEINTDFMGDLLRDGGGEGLAELVKMYSSMVESSLGFSDAPEIELDYNQLDLDEGDSDPGEVPDDPTPEAQNSEPANPPNTDETGASEEWGEPLPHQAGFEMRETEIEIKDVGVFRRGSGQPIQLRAYPYVRPKPASPSERQPQAYREQDHYNPAWTHVRSTRRDRLQALVKAKRESGTPT